MIKYNYIEDLTNKRESLDKQKKEFEHVDKSRTFFYYISTKKVCFQRVGKGLLLDY